MRRVDMQEYLRARPRVAAFIVLPCHVLFWTVTSGVAYLLDAGPVVALALLLVGLVGGFSLSRMALHALMGPD